VIRRSILIALALVGSAGVASAQLALTTLFARNNSGSPGGAIYFDVEVKLKTTLLALDCNFGAAVGTPVRLEIWATEDTRVGKLGDQSLWELVATDDGSAQSAGVDQPTRVTLAKPLKLAPGRFGVALVAFDTNHHYTNVARTDSDGFLAIEMGEASNVPFDGNAFSPRSWNGRLIYGPKSVKGPFLYAYDDESGALHGFLLDKKTGVPGQLLGSPFAVSGGQVNCGGNCQTLAGDPAGRFVFAATGSGLAVLRKGLGGVLEQVPGSPFAGSSGLIGIGTWSSGNVLLVFGVANDAGLLNVFEIDPTTGAAALRPEAPSIGAPDGGIGIAVGRTFLYVVNEDEANVHGFSIDAITGALTPTPNSPYSIPGISEPFNLALDAKQTVLAMNDCDDGDFGFATIDKLTGALLFPVVIQGASACSEVFGFSSKGVFYGGGDSVIDVIASGPTLVGSPTMPAFEIDLGVIAPKGGSVYFIGATSLHHAPVDKRLLVPIASRTTTLSEIFADSPTGTILVAK
jgi:hypothetical protein